MRFKKLHPWSVSYQEAVGIQAKLRDLLILDGLNSRPQIIAGADVAYSKQTNLVYAVVVVFELDGMKILEKASATSEASFPYIPGLLSFREAPVLLKAFGQLKTEPEVILFDGQGIAHPRGLGLASHVGLLLDKPSVGCAKDLLVGKHGQVGITQGAHSYIYYKGRCVGAALRTRRRVKPVFVSPGYKINLDDAIRVVLSSCRGYRLPEPLRQAHNLVTQLRSSSRN